MPGAKTEVALQFSECCAAEAAPQHRLFCSAEVIWTRSCTAANEKLHCNIEEAALQESGAFLPLSCGFQAPTFRHPRLGPAESDMLQKIRQTSHMHCSGATNTTRFSVKTMKIMGSTRSCGEARPTKLIVTGGRVKKASKETSRANRQSDMHGKRTKPQTTPDQNYPLSALQGCAT